MYHGIIIDNVGNGDDVEEDIDDDHNDSGDGIDDDLIVVTFDEEEINVFNGDDDKFDDLIFAVL